MLLKCFKNSYVKIAKENTENTMADGHKIGQTILAICLVN